MGTVRLAALAPLLGALLAASAPGAEVPLLGGRIHLDLPRGATVQPATLSAVEIALRSGVRFRAREVYLLAQPDLAALAGPGARPAQVPGARSALETAVDPAMPASDGSVLLARWLIEMADRTVIEVTALARRSNRRALERERAEASRLFAALTASTVPLAPGGPVEIAERPPIRVDLPSGFALSSFLGPHGVAWRIRKVVPPSTVAPEVDLDFGLVTPAPAANVPSRTDRLLGAEVAWTRLGDPSDADRITERAVLRRHADEPPLTVTLIGDRAAIEELRNLAASMH